MHLNSNLFLMEDRVPLSIAPALPVKELLRIVQDTFNSLVHNLDVLQQQFFLKILTQVREKRFTEIFNENGRLLGDNFWKYKNVSFMYNPKMSIHELFTKRSGITILQTIWNTLKSDSANWFCLINQNTAYVFVLSINNYLLWSPIITGLISHFIASIFLDITLLNRVDDSSRWGLLEEEKSQLLRFFKRWIKKTSYQLNNKEPVVSRFFLQMKSVLIVQKTLLESINRKLVSFHLIKEINDFIIAYDQISKLLNERDCFTIEPSLETSELQIYDSIIENLNLSDYPWVLDIHPLNFIEIMPQIINEAEYRKSGGFYTPIALAESIVTRSFETFISQGLTKPITSLKVFDPAMGTGVLLVFALEWIVSYIMPNSSLNYSFIDLRQNILHSCIYGQDIDKDSVLISSTFLKLFCMHEMGKKEIPLNLSLNDFVSSFVKNINSNKLFPKYDVILSNPPYLAFHSRFTKEFPLKRELKTLRHLIPVFSGKRDNAYLLFLGICLQRLLEPNGVVGFVIDHSFLDLPSYSKIREFLLSNYHVSFILANYSYRKTAIVDLSLLVISQTKNDQQIVWQETLTEEPQKIPKNHFLSQPNFMFRYQKIPSFFSNIQDKSTPLGEIVTATCGLEYGSLLKTHFLSANENGFYACIDGSNGLSQPYFLFWAPGQPNSYVRFDKKYEKHLQDTNQNVSRTKKKVILISGSLERFLTNKIILRQTASKFIATLDERKYLTLRNTHVIYNPNPPYSLFLILGILNSSLGNWIGEYLNIIRKPRDKSSRYPQIRLNDLKKFPIIDINRIDDDSIIPQLETAVRECLKIGESITEALTKLWDIFQDSGVKFAFQRQFLQASFSKNILTRLSSIKQLDKAKIWNTVLQKKLTRLSSQKEEINSIVYELYSINQQDQQFIEDNKQ